MRPPENALVIGAGNFGGHYVRILSQLNAEAVPDIPVIDNLIITRTTRERARQAADMIKAREDFSVNDIIASELSEPRHLMDLIEKYQPGFIAIAARDRNKGDSIHAVYTTYALKSGAVLCEKPFSNASGDGSSLKYFEDLFDYENKGLFGLELPCAVVMHALTQKKEFRSLYRNVRHLAFFWETHVTLKNYIIDDLALHPWSLIPREYPIKAVEVTGEGNTAHIRLGIENPHTEQYVGCNIKLREGGNFRGMSLDDYVIGLKSEQASIKLIRLHVKLEEAVSLGTETPEGEILLEIDNPLKQNIIAVLEKEPIVNLKRAFESQIFLERLHGYIPG